MSAVVNRIGEKVGRLTVIARLPRRTSDHHAWWWCDCECGERCIVSSDHLKTTKSCGKCLSRKNEPLTQARLKQLLDYNPETGEFFWKVVNKRNHPGGCAGGIDNSHGYWRITVDGNRYRAHRLVWLWWFGYFPKEELDHKNRNRSDNRLSNLREATPRQGQANRKAKKGSHSGLKGAFRHGQRWQAAIKQSGKNVHLGTFDTAIAAHEAYCKAAQELHGEFFCDGIPISR
jgi:hypothetical protein